MKTVKTTTVIDQQQNDHDLIIRLDTKFDQMASDIKELKDGTTSRLVELEQRVDTIEETHDRLHVTETAQTVAENTRWINDFNVRWKLIIALASGISAVVGFIAALIYHLAGFIPK